MRPGPSAADVAAMLLQRRAEWLPRFYPAGRKVGGVFELGSADGEPGRSFPIPLYRRPRVTDFAGGFSGDDLALFARAIGAGDDMAKAYQEALVYLGITPGSPTPPRPVRQPVEPDRRAAQPAAWRLWHSARPIEPGTIAASYLERRGCVVPSRDTSLRWHPDVPHSGEPGAYRGPALVALVTDPETGEPVTVHLTWILGDGSKPAALGKKARKFWYGLPSFGVCRLFGDDEVTLGLALAEGLESGLAAAAAFGPATWATLSACNMAAIPALAGIETVTVITDHDRPDSRGRRAGEAAATTLGRRWRDAGREVRIWVSPIEGKDFADVAKELAA